MGRFEIGDKVVYKGHEYRIEGKRKDFATKTATYFLAGFGDPINDVELSPLFVEKKATNKKAEFAKKLIEHDERRA